MDFEIWKQIEGFSKYEISSFGNVRNKLILKVLKPCTISGYYAVNILNNDGNNQCMLNHRLVALNFIENPENKKTVNHIDHNPKNNNLKNLEWATHKEQNLHKLKSTKHRTLVNIWRVDKNTDEKLEKYNSRELAAKFLFDNKLTNYAEFNYNNSMSLSASISAVCAGKRKSAYGYKWMYDDRDDNEKIFDDEVWKDIPKEYINDSVNDYKISSYGRIKNKNEKITTGYSHTNGYLKITILNKKYTLHRLVAQVFIPNPENKTVVNHKNGDKLDPTLGNLEWMTPRENSQHSCDNSFNSKIRKITQYDLSLNKIKEFNSYVEAAKELNLNPACIGRCCNNKQARTGNFIFKFSENINPEINKNKVELNTKVDNVVSMTHNEKLQHAKNIGVIVPNTKKITQYTLDNIKIKDFSSITEAVNELNIANSNISRCCKNKQKTARGFIFKYSTDPEN